MKKRMGKQVKRLNTDKDVLNSYGRHFGIDRESIKSVEKTEDLRESPPGLVTAKALKNFSINQNGFIKKLIKKNTYVMSVMTYKNLWVDKEKNVKLLTPGTFKFKNIYRPYLGEDLNNKSILFIRHGGIGDLLFINVLLQNIKEKYPTCKVTFATGISYKKMIENWTDLIDDLIELPLLANEFRKYDYHVVFEGVIERNKEAQKINAYDLFAKWVNLDIPDEKKIPRQTPKLEKITQCNMILNGLELKEKGFIVLQPDASSPIRTPSDEFWVKVINMFTSKGYKIVVTNSKHKREKMAELIAKCFDTDKIFNFANENHELDLMIALISLSSFVISTDSASLHIAASLDIPMFGIYGPFLGELRLSTYKNADWINAKTNCSPCFLHQYNPCKFSNLQGNPKCFDTIDVQEIFDRSMKLLEKNKGN